MEGKMQWTQMKLTDTNVYKLPTLCALESSVNVYVCAYQTSLTHLIYNIPQSCFI